MALNAPVALAAWKGWSYPAMFQGARHATWGSLVSWVTSPPWGITRVAEFSDPAKVANTIAFGLLAVGLLAISIIAVRRRLGAAAIGAAVVAVFMLSNKVYSPNYDVWLVPFFVLVPFSRRQWVAFCAADLAMYVVVFGRFHGLVDSSVTGNLVPVIVVIRAVVIGSMIVTALGGWKPGARALRRLGNVQRAPRMS